MEQSTEINTKEIIKGLNSTNTPKYQYKTTRSASGTLNGTWRLIDISKILSWFIETKSKNS